MTRRRAAFGRRVVAALALLVAAFLPAAALAHATLVGSTPRDGVVLERAPATLALAFNEPVSVVALSLSGASGAVGLDRFRSNGAAVEIDAPAGLADGSYALSYRVVSEDGHPVSGAVAFAIGAAGALPAAALETADTALAAAIWATRLALSIGLLAGAGGAVALAWITGPGGRGRSAVAAAVAVGLAATPAALALQGAALVGTGLGGAVDGAAWRQALATSYAATAALAAAALVLALASLAARPGLARALSGLSLVGVGLAVAASGHAGAADPQALMRPAVFIHAAAAAAWIGALAPLWLALREDAVPTALRRFSSAAPVVVAALLVSGAALAIRQVEAPAALWSTDYGRVLSAKLGLVALLLALAAANRWRWTRRAAAGEGPTRRALRRAIAAEIAIAVVILGVVALWRFTPPPRALADAEPAAVHLHGRAAQADVTIAPGRAGPADLTIVVTASDFGPLDAKGVTVALSNTLAGVEPIRREARKVGEGPWRVEGLRLPAPGAWTLRVEILVTDFDVERLEGSVEIRR